MVGFLEVFHRELSIRTLYPVIYLEDIRFQLVLGLRGLAPDVVRGSKRGQLGLGGRLAFLRQGVNRHVLNTEQTDGHVGDG